LNIEQVRKLKEREQMNSELTKVVEAAKQQIRNAISSVRTTQEKLVEKKLSEEALKEIALLDEMAEAIVDRTVDLYNK